MNSRKIMIVLTGMQGSGKGSQAEMLAKEWNLKHISTGDALRDAIVNKTAFGLEYQSFYEKGEFAPNEIVCGIINEAIENSDGYDGFILDGFPRTKEQLDWLACNHTVDIVVELKCSEETAIKRMLSRGRTDDNIEAIQKRLDDWKNITKKMWLTHPNFWYRVVWTDAPKMAVYDALKRTISEKICDFYKFSCTN